MNPDPPHTRIPPPAILARGTPAAVLAALPGARAVGGAVRDTLAGLPVQDVDIAAPFPPEEVARRLTAAGLKVFETGLAHGTLTAVLAREPVEVTSLRRDLATDGRHATVAWTTDWREDAARRDVTINALSMNEAGEVWDYFGGREDLAAGRVRFVGDPATRLAEDRLRALRFFRFQARYGSGAPDPAALAAIRDAVPALGRLSAERVWMELKRLLTAPDPTGALALMAALGVLAAVLPEGFALPRLGALIGAGAPPDPLLRLAALLTDGADARALAARLRLSAEEAERLAALRALAPASPGPDAMARSFAFRAWRAAVQTRSRLVTPEEPAWLAEAARGGTGWPALRAHLAAEPAPEFPLRGRDALALGIPAGPQVGALLAEARAAWIATDCTASRDSCLARLRELAAARGLI